MGTQLPFQMGTAPIPCLLWPIGWMDQDATWYGGSPLPRPHCVRWGPHSSKRGTAAPPSFRPMSSVVAKRWPISATAEHLSLLFLRFVIVRCGVSAVWNGWMILKLFHDFYKSVKYNIHQLSKSSSSFLAAIFEFYGIDGPHLYTCLYSQLTYQIGNLTNFTRLLNVYKKWSWVIYHEAN